MKNYIFLRNKNYRPSTYYRMYQYLKDVNKHNIIISEYELDNYYVKKNLDKKIKSIIYSLAPGYLGRLIQLIKINLSRENYNIIVQREVFPRYIGLLGRYLLKQSLREAKKVIWDFDDNIIDEKEISNYEKEILFKYSDKIIVGNEFLKDICPDIIKDKVIIINTTDKMVSDINLFNINKKRINEFDKKINMVWLGTKGNIGHLIRVIPIIDQAVENIKEKEFVLKVISDGNVELKTNNLKIINEKWSRDQAIKSLEYAHIGLMPLEENRLTKGKCAFKAIQYIGMGIPPVLSNVGMNHKTVSNKNGFIFNNDRELQEAIVALCNNKYEWEQYSIKSRLLWEEKFNSKNIELILSDMLFNNEVKKC